MANYTTVCRICGSHFQGQTASKLCYNCLEAENLALKHRLQCILGHPPGDEARSLPIHWRVVHKPFPNNQM